MANGPSFGGIALRALSALVLVFSTYKPEGKSYYHWTVAPLINGTPSTGHASVKFLTGIALLAGWAVFTEQPVAPSDSPDRRWCWPSRADWCGCCSTSAS